MAGYGIDQLTRMITNLYSAAFEKTTGVNSSGPLRRVQQYNTDPSQLVSEVSLPYLIGRDNPYIWFPMANDPYYGLASQVGYYPTSQASLFTVLPVGPSLIGNDQTGGSLVSTTAGINTHVNLADVATMYSVTIEMLIQSTDTGNGRRLLAGWFSSAGITNGCEVGLCLSAGYLEGSVRSGDLIISTPTLIADGAVHHIALTYTANGTLTLYIDGAASVSGVAPAGPIVTTNLFGVTTLTLSANHNFVGSLQHVAAYRQLLSPAQILEHYNSLVSLSNLASGGTLIENAGAFFAPTPRYYADLQMGGGNTSEDPSAWDFNAGAVYARYPSTILNTTQMWGAIRLSPSWAFTGAPPTPSFFRWADSPTSRLILSYTAGAWQFDRLSSTGGAAAITGTHSIYSTLTLGFYCDATHTAISLNGGNWVTAANTTIPSIGAGLFDIGNGDNQCNSRVYWAMLGLGTIGNSDIAALHAMGNKDPYWSDIPNISTLNPTFLWAAKDQTNEPTAEWGVSVYA